jgi:hypothetical protein
MSIKKILVCIWFVFSATVLSEAKEWRGIIPLHSTRVDVEHLLGTSVEKCKDLNCLYNLETETVFIIYASGAPCSKNDAASAWNVPRDTVIEITVRIKGRDGRPLSDLKIDISKYKKIADPENPALIYYINGEEGLRVEVSGDRYYGITYFQTAKDNQLLCHQKISE